MKNFIRAMLIRAVRTFAQAAVAAIGTSALLSDVDWLAVLSVAALSAILSILTSVITDLPEAPKGGGPDE